MKFTADAVASKKRFILLGETQTLIARSIAKFATHHEIPVRNDPSQIDEKDTDIFFINPTLRQNIIVPQNSKSRVNYIFTTYSDKTRDLGKLLLKNEDEGTKIIHLDGDTQDYQVIDRIMWFILSRSTEDSIFIRINKQSKHTSSKSIPPIKQQFHFRLRHIIYIFITSQLFFLIPLSISVIFLFNAFQSTKHGDFISSSNTLRYAKNSIVITKMSYALSRPILGFLYIDSYVDNIVTSTDIAEQTLQEVIITSQNSLQLLGLITQPTTSTSTTREIILRLKTLKQQTTQLEKNTALLSGKLSRLPLVAPSDTQKLSSLSQGIRKFNNIIDFAPQILGKDRQKKYIVFFYNNMELRPGGGFLGSYAEVLVKNYHLESYKIFDVYDVDGQLKDHIEPPDAIRTYLHQPHWFLRDSNFTPNFDVNAKMAEFFLSKERGEKNIDGFVGVTTTALSNLLEAFPPLYLPDYNETITSDNFFLKTQTGAESGHFEGAQNKKNYLSALGKAMTIASGKASLFILGQNLQKSLTEKHIVLYMKHNEINTLFQANGWDGRLSSPQCIGKDSCLLNYIAIIDANLGVNKTNYYVTRQMRLLSRFDLENHLTTEALIIFSNQSPTAIFPGGTYKNYLQVYIPLSSFDIALYVNGLRSRTATQRKSGNSTIVADLITIPPKRSATVKVTYKLATPVNTNQYQFVVQKQIGSINNEMSVVFDTGNSTYSLTPLNFTAVENDRQLLYNTTLAIDRVFIVKTNKQR